MVLRSIDEVLRNRAAVQIDELNSKTVGELREIAATIDLGAVNRNGRNVSYYKARKGELIDAIREVCSLTLSRSSPIVVERQGKWFEIATKYWKNLQVICEQNNPNPNLKTLDGRTKIDEPPGKSVELLAEQLLEEVTNMKHKGEPLKPNSVLQNSREVCRIIHDYLVDGYRTTSPWFDHYQSYSKYFGDHVKKITDSLQLLKLDAEKNRRENFLGEIDEKKGNKTVIKYARAVLWAEGVIHSMPSLVARDWKKVVVALLILTGRRQAEIMCTANFEYVDDSTLWFTGQMKERDEKAGRFKIPLLRPLASEIVDAHRVLTFDWGKHEDDPKRAHNNYSRYINETSAEIFGRYVDVLEAGYESDKSNAHKFRAFYAVSCVTGKGITDSSKSFAYAAMILGEKSIKASDVYLRGYEISDVAEFM